MLEVQPHCKGEEKGLASNLVTLSQQFIEQSRFTEMHLTHIDRYIDKQLLVGTHSNK